MDMKWDSSWDLDHGVPIGPQLHRILRERIVRNNLAPGSKVSESEIARTYGISRQPVREAFIKLAEEGLIAVRPQRGTIVRKIDSAAVLDARFVREAIEADIVKLLAAEPDPALVAELRTQLATQERQEGEDPGRFILLDELFHRTLAEAAGKASVWSFVEGLKSQMDRVRYLSYGQFPTRQLIIQHAAIIDAIAQGRADAAEAAIRAHLRQIIGDLPLIQAVCPEFFDHGPDTGSGE